MQQLTIKEKRQRLKTFFQQENASKKISHMTEQQVLDLFETFIQFRKHALIRHDN